MKMDDTPKPRTLSRREFGRRAATVVAAAIAQPILMAHADSPEPAKLPALPLPSPKPQGDEAVVDSKMDDIIRKYGDRLSNEQRDRLRGIVRDNQTMLKRVRAVSLNNDDTPATGLRLYPKDTE